MRLHIGNVPKNMADTELKEVVAAFGEVSTFEIARDRDGGSKGFAFVDFASDDNAKAAISGLDGKEVGGQSLKVSEARPRKGDAPAAATA
jgi:RNA recognition motif-containing protein